MVWSRQGYAELSQIANLETVPNLLAQCVKIVLKGSCLFPFGFSFRAFSGVTFGVPTSCPDEDTDEDDRWHEWTAELWNEYIIDAEHDAAALPLVRAKRATRLLSINEMGPLVYCTKFLSLKDQASDRKE